MQYAKGYSALEAGAAMVPLAFGLVLGARLQHQARRAPRHHARRGRRARWASARCSRRPCCGRPTCPTGRSACWFFGVALSMGWIIGPATESVMGAVPEEKAGVASAMNDVTRQVAGALGTAVIGSLITSLYASRIARLRRRPAGCGAGRGQGLDRQGQRGGRPAAGRRGEPRRHGGGRVHRGAGDRLPVAGAVAVLAAIVVKLWLPARHRAAEQQPGAAAQPQPA